MVRVQSGGLRAWEGCRAVPAETGTAMPREADESWPFSVRSHSPCPSPSSHGIGQAGTSCFPLQQPHCAAGGTWPGPALGLKCQVLERDAECAAASCALECFSPSCALLGQGELLWGVTEEFLGSHSDAGPEL